MAAGGIPEVKVVRLDGVDALGPVRAALDALGPRACRWPPCARPAVRPARRAQRPVRSRGRAAG